ncbi:UNVERIFIED_CONTAM: hypothetical protein Sangu_3242300 [Sesamum angustifolium]|uniref:Uncharacterized protein n=1 Tax=Sesamum angustifolium TaxID=2727405 RepID=A0AAW2JG67_9LAMI
MMSTSAPPPPGRGRRGQGRVRGPGRGPPIPPRAEPANPTPITPSLEAISQSPLIHADLSAVRSDAAGATSS